MLQPAPHLFSTVGPEPVPCCPLSQKHITGSWKCAGLKRLQTDNTLTDLPRGSHTRTTSTHQSGKCCGTTWRGPAKLKTSPCSWDKAAGLFPGTHNPTRTQQHSNAASCCLHLHQSEEKVECVNCSKCTSNACVSCYRYVLALAPRTAASAELRHACKSAAGLQALSQ